MRPAKTFDAIILGGGIAALGAARALLRRRKKVLILAPKKPLAGEATPASAGILDPFLESADPHQPFFKLKKAAFRRLPAEIRRIERESGVRTGYRRTGMFFTALNPAEEKKLKARLRAHRPSGIPIRWLTRAQALKRWPFLGPDVRGVLFYPTIAQIFPALLQKALKKVVTARAGRHGAVWQGIGRTMRLHIQKGRVAGVSTGGRLFFADCVINAGGSWAGNSGISPWRLPIFPVRGQIVVVRGQGLKLQSVIHSAGGIYIVPWSQNHYLLGSTVEKAGFKATVQPKTLQRIRQGAAQLVPRLKTFKAVQAWAGLRPCSADHLPVLGKTPLAGYYMAAAYYRSGIVIGLYAGELLARAIDEKKIPAELQPFSPMRWFNRT